MSKQMTGYQGGPDMSVENGIVKRKKERKKTK